MKRGYERMSTSEVDAAYTELTEKRKKIGLSCRESGKLDYCKNVKWKPDFYASKK